VVGGAAAALLDAATRGQRSLASETIALHDM